MHTHASDFYRPVPAGQGIKLCDLPVLWQRGNTGKAAVPELVPVKPRTPLRGAALPVWATHLPAAPAIVQPVLVPSY